MTTRTPAPAAEPVDLLLVLALAATEALAVLAVAALALLLTLAGWCPSRPSAPPLRPAPLVAPLEALTVADLRRLARAAGRRDLARRGRRAELLAALASHWPTRIELSSMGQLYSQCKSQRMI